MWKRDLEAVRNVPQHVARPVVRLLVVTELIVCQFWKLLSPVRRVGVHHPVGRGGRSVCARI